MKRRLIQLGNKSFSVTIPKTWVRRNHLTSKNYLDIIDRGNNLVISAGSSVDSHETKILKIDDIHHEEVISRVIGYYRDNYSEIRLTFEKASQKTDALASFFTKLKGVFVEYGSESIRIFRDCGKESYSPAARKCLQILMHLCDLVENDESPDPHQFQESYEEIFFVSEMMFRLIVIHYLGDIEKVCRYYSLAWNMQFCAEILKRMFEHQCNTVKGVKNQIREIYEIYFKEKSVTEFYAQRDTLLKQLHPPESRELIHMFCYATIKLVKILLQR